MTNSAAQQRLTDWFRRWRAPLREFLVARRAVHRADLDDVAQEVFLRLLRYDRAELVEQPQAYLFKMASNVAAEWAIRARHRCPHDPKWLGDLLADEQPEKEVARESERQEVERAINTLPLRLREVLKLHFNEGLGHADIATRIGTSQRAVKRYLANSYARLRLELDTRERE